MASTRRAQIIGTGLIGGSIGLRLRAGGWHVTGYDIEPGRADQAAEVGVVDAVGMDADAEITFVATPADALSEAVHKALAGTSGRVTDVGSVKSHLVGQVDDPRFVGGHPMAGSEQEGVKGADGSLFEGAIWVLTPSANTDDSALAFVSSVIGSLGAEVISLDPDRHDALVAVVSHVPHLTAATLMCLADERSEAHAALLRLAAGGFRDMTRIAAGHPGIWPDICTANSAAIVDVLDELVGRLRAIRDIVADANAAELLDVLEQARRARASLPGPAGRPDELLVVRVPIPDRAGELAKITMLAADLNVNIHDIEIAHSAEGDRGVLVLVVDPDGAERLSMALLDLDYHPSTRALE